MSWIPPERNHLHGFDCVLTVSCHGRQTEPQCLLAPGKVDFADLAILSDNYGRDVDVAFAEGDFDGDGDVDFADLVILANNFGR